MTDDSPSLSSPRDRLGRPLEDLRISVIDRCNFRCTFCMPTGHEYSFLPRRELLTFEEITRLARVFVDLGVGKLRLTGGEPLLRQEIEKLVAMLSAIDGVADLALTTNGVLLADKAQTLADAGLGRVTVSLPSLREDVFATMNGLGHRVGDVLRGIDAAEHAGLGPIKINVVVMKGVNDDEVVELARYFKKRGNIVRFIEYMDVGTLNGWDPGAVLSARDILTRIGESMPLSELERRKPSDVALRFGYEDDGVELGAIASVTEPFCGECGRARLSAEGKLFTCLFSSAGNDLKQLLRAGASSDEIAERIVSIWTQRADRYSEERAEMLRSGSSIVDSRVEMFRIGG
jgi:cyclic pyranopterin phosphate synthase